MAEKELSIDELEKVSGGVNINYNDAKNLIKCIQNGDTFGAAMLAVKLILESGIDPNQILQLLVLYAKTEAIIQEIVDQIKAEGIIIYYTPESDGQMPSDK